MLRAAVTSYFHVNRVLRGSLTHSQTLIVSEIMRSTRSSPAIRSQVGGDRIAPNEVASDWSGGFCRHRAEADVYRIGEDVCHALREDDVVGRSHRVA
jgi:hypothetical protein